MQLLLLPGMDGTGLLFEWLVPQLPSSLPARIAELPADRPFGYDELLPIVRAALPEDDDAVIVAESFSGPLALRCARDAPPRLRGVVLVSTFAVAPLPRWTAPLGALARHAPTWMIAQALTNGCECPNVSARVRDAASRVAPRAWRARLHALATLDDRAALASASVPLLSLRASRDRVVPRRRAISSMRADVPEIVVDGPHLLLQCAPRACAAHVVEFVARVAR